MFSPSISKNDAVGFGNNIYILLYNIIYSGNIFKYFHDYFQIFIFIWEDLLYIYIYIKYFQYFQIYQINYMGNIIWDFPNIINFCLLDMSWHVSMTFPIHLGFPKYQYIFIGYNDIYQWHFPNIVQKMTFHQRICHFHVNISPICGHFQRASWGTSPPSGMT